MQGRKKQNNDLGVLRACRRLNCADRKRSPMHSCILNRYLSASRLLLVDEYNHDLHPWHVCVRGREVVRLKSVTGGWGGSGVAVASAILRENWETTRGYVENTCHRRMWGSTEGSWNETARHTRHFQLNAPPTFETFCKKLVNNVRCGPTTLILRIHKHVVLWVDQGFKILTMWFYEKNHVEDVEEEFLIRLSVFQRAELEYLLNLHLTKSKVNARGANGRLLFPRK